MGTAPSGYNYNLYNNAAADSYLLKVTTAPTPEPAAAFYLPGRLRFWFGVGAACRKLGSE